MDKGLAIQPSLFSYLEPCRHLYYSLFERPKLVFIPYICNMNYVEVILPLDLKEYYHYYLSNNLIEGRNIEDLIGCRVSVSFGPKRFYTGLLRRVVKDLPPIGLASKQIKAVDAILDVRPILSEGDFLFWEWLAEYYQASVGQVMREAMPKALYPESETYVLLNPDFVALEPLKTLEENMLDILASQGSKGLLLKHLRIHFGRSLSITLERLLRLGAITLEENLNKGYREKKVSFVRLTPDYQNEEALAYLLDCELKRAKQQAFLLEEFLAHLDDQKGQTLSNLKLERSILTAGDNRKNTSLRALLTKGVLELFDLSVSRFREQALQDSDDLWDERGLLPYRKQALSSDIHYLYSSGSQAKENYLIAQIQNTLESGGQVLFLRTSLSMGKLYSSLDHHLAQAIKQNIYYYDSSLSEQKRSELFLNSGANDEPCLIMGGRNAIFLPLKKLSLIIVDEEQEYTYKQQFAQPMYHSRDVALWLAWQKNIPIILSSETPSAESLFNIFRGKYKLIDLDEALSQKIQLKVQIETVNLKEQRAIGQLASGHSLSIEVRDEIKRVLDAGERVIVLKNRRGYAPYIICNNCSEQILCPHCEVSMNYHYYSRLLECHYCGRNQELPRSCPSCHADKVAFYNKEIPALALVGYGVERVEEELKEYFPKANILGLDSERMKSQKRKQSIYEQLVSDEVDILVGTQLLRSESLFSCGTRAVGLIVVVQLDELLAYPDFRTEERAYQLLYQLIMRQSECLTRPSKMLIQTTNPEQEFIEQLRLFDYQSFINKQLEDRELLNFPPFCRLSYVLVKGFSEELVDVVARRIVDLLRSVWSSSERISVVQKPSVVRVEQQYMRRIVCKRPFQESFKKEREVFTWLLVTLNDEMPESRRTRIIFDVDPL